MIVSAGFAAPWVGQTLPSAIEQVLDAPHALVCVNDAVRRARTHARAADQVRVALNREDVLRAGGLEGCS